VVVSIEMSMGQMVEDVERVVKGKCPFNGMASAVVKYPHPRKS